MYGDSQRAVANWVRRFKKHGAKGLQELTHPGRPPTIKPSQLNELRNFVAKSRAKSQRISGSVLAAFIKRAFGITLTRQHCLRILKRLER